MIPPAQDARRRVVLDLDTGIDDLVALLIAATAPELNLRGVMCVAGNVELRHVARNTAKALAMLGRTDVPVSIGAAGPLSRRLRTATETHGPTGTGYASLRGEDPKLGATEFTALPASRYLAAHVGRHPGELSVVALGPLTNLAQAARDGVDLASGLRETIWMGGTFSERGNTTPTGEWNACVDPEAAEACLQAGVIDRLFPLEATQDLVVTMADLDALPDTPLAGVVRDAMRFYAEFHRAADGIDGAYLHDPVTLIGGLLRPDLVRWSEPIRLTCDTGPDPATAGTLRPADDDRPTLIAALALDVAPIKAELLDRLRRAVAGSPP